MRRFLASFMLLGFATAAVCESVCMCLDSDHAHHSLVSETHDEEHPGAHHSAMMESVDDQSGVDAAGNSDGSSDVPCPMAVCGTISAPSFSKKILQIPIDHGSGLTALNHSHDPSRPELDPPPPKIS